MAQKYTVSLPLVNPWLIAAHIDAPDNQPMVDDKARFKSFLAKELARRGLTRADLAEYSQQHGGPSKTAIYKWFNTGNISKENLPWLAKATGIDYESLWRARHGSALPSSIAGGKDAIREGPAEYRQGALSARATAAALELDQMPGVIAEHFFALIRAYGNNREKP